MDKITPGTEFSFPESPSVRWRVVRFVEHIEDDSGGWDSYRCEQLSGDRSLYERDRRDDDTVDIVGEEIEKALGIERVSDV